MFVAEKKSIAMSLLFPPVSCSLTSSIKSKPLTKCQHFFGRTDSTMTDPSQPRPPGSYFSAPLTAQAVLNKAKHTVPAFCTPALIYLQNVYISVQLYLCKFAESWILHFTGRSLAYRPHSTVSLYVPRPGLPQPGLCVFTEGGCLFELQPWVQLTSSVCMCPLHPPPTTTEAAGTGSLNKTELDGALWSHIPFILDLIFAERRQRALQRQPTFLQASTDLRQGCPRCTHYTHPHTPTHTHTHTVYIRANTPSAPFMYVCLCLLTH